MRLFARRVLSPAERCAAPAALARCLAAPDAAPHADDVRASLLFLAGRWAAKEACYKALSAHCTLRWSDVSISNDSAGRPSIALDSRVLGVLGGPVAAHVSISHDGEYAMASVLFERPTAAPSVQ
ncbi:hypothetical protein HDU82_006843 [Entophlyctis luteolus]|nr:hypothetical protein HDU82_006843 [Entophlyctis luteolus]